MKALLVAVVLLLSACATSSLKPSIFTMPNAYLQSYPLGTTEDQMILQAGPPTRYTVVAGKNAMVYEVGEDYGLRTYTYILEEGKVSDVLYNDNSTWNGTTARAKQGL